MPMYLELEYDAFIWISAAESHDLGAVVQNYLNKNTCSKRRIVIHEKNDDILWS